MTTLSVDPASCRADDLREAVAWIRAGRIVVFPTDTFYGLAVDPESAAAVRDLFRLKGRASGAAVPLIAASVEQAGSLGGVWTPAMRALARTFWPGPVSLICEAPGAMARDVHGGAGTVAVRVPDHPVARALAEAWGAPVTATSANRSGEPPAQTVDMVSDLASDPAVLVVDAGPTPGGQPSTIVDARGETMVLVRAGAIAWNRVLESIQG
jgi:L-threonylcarbamoyladenylate synthase